MTIDAAATPPAKGEFDVAGKLERRELAVFGWFENAIEDAGEGFDLVDSFGALDGEVSAVVGPFGVGVALVLEFDVAR